MWLEWLYPTSWMLSFPCCLPAFSLAILSPGPPLLSHFFPRCQKALMFSLLGVCFCLILLFHFFLPAWPPQRPEVFSEFWIAYRAVPFPLPWIPWVANCCSFHSCLPCYLCVWVQDIKNTLTLLWWHVREAYLNAWYTYTCFLSFKCPSWCYMCTVSSTKQDPPHTHTGNLFHYPAPRVKKPAAPKMIWFCFCLRNLVKPVFSMAGSSS